MDLIQSPFQPPYDNPALESISQNQLLPFPVPDDYLKQLRHHLRAFPHDYLFKLYPHKGDGFGIVICLEPGCSSDPIVLRARTSKPDGGRSTGVGGLAAFQSHILEHHLHKALRERRLRRKESFQRSQDMPKRSNSAAMSSPTPLTVLNGTSTVNNAGFRSSPHLDLIPNLHRADTVRTPTGLIPVSPSKRALASPSGPSDKKQRHSATKESNRPIPSQRSSINGLTPFKTKTRINTLAHRSSPLIDLNSSDSDVHIIPDKLGRNKAGGSIEAPPSSDNDEVMVWVDGEGLVPLKGYSTPRASTKLPPARQSGASTSRKSHLSNPLEHIDPDLTLHRQKKYIAQPSALLGHKALPVGQSSVAGSPFPMNIKPVPMDIKPVSMDIKPVPMDIKPVPKISQSVTPLLSSLKPHHIGSSSQPSQFSSPSAGVHPKLKRESTPYLSAGSGLLTPSAAPASVPESSMLSDIKPPKPPTELLSGMDPYGSLENSLQSLGLPNRLSDMASNLFANYGMGPGMSMPDRPPEMRADELHEFYKRAVENIDFAHNATVAESRKALGIAEDADARMEGLSVLLMPHQILGVSWMVKQEMEKNSGGILADEMGLGKTIQMIATMVKNHSTDSKVKATLILAPLALLTQWKDEIIDKSTCDLKILIYHQSFCSKQNERKKISSYDIVITTLDTLSSDWDDDKNVYTKKPRGLFKVEWYRIVIDEAQIIRNPNAKKSRAVCQLKSTYRWCLTGTPIFNGLMDIFPYLRFLHIRPYNDISEFRGHISRYEKNNPNLATKRAQAVLATCMIRRQKDSKLDGKPLIVLPKKHRTDVMLDLSPDERDIYDMLEKQAQRKFNVFLRRGTVLKNFACILVLLLRLRQACGHPSLTIEQGHPDEGKEFDTSFDPSFLNPHSELQRALMELGQAWVDKTKQKFVTEAEELIKIEKKDPSQAAAPECPICSDPLDDTSRITSCGHVFCQGCIETLFTQTDPMMADASQTDIDLIQKPCPNCRHPFRRNETYLQKAFIEPKDDGDDDEELPGGCLVRRKMRHGILDDESDGEEPSTSKGKEKESNVQSSEFVPSTKLVWMLEEIVRAKKEFPTDKTIVISQWTGMLAICATFLRERHMRYVQYQGDMCTLEREDAVASFKRKSDVSIMLMSLKCGGVGLNLTCANRVISLDLAWSPSSESQAFDRTHRLGQSKEVFINRVMIQNSVEQRICDLQRKKQDISDNALGEGNGKKLKRLTVGELASLFNLNTNGEVLS